MDGTIRTTTTTMRGKKSIIIFYSAARNRTKMIFYLSPFSFFDFVCLFVFDWMLVETERKKERQIKIIIE